jgi:hypothetical protein
MQPTLEGVSRIAEFIIAVTLPTVAVGAMLWGLRGLRWLAEARRRPVPAEPIERLEARLRRLRSQLELTENQHGLTAKRHRVAALRGAYADTLSAACQRLGVPPPPGGDRAALADIYQAEAALRQRGVDVREPAAR